MVNDSQNRTWQRAMERYNQGFQPVYAQPGGNPNLKMVDITQFSPEELQAIVDAGKTVQPNSAGDNAANLMRKFGTFFGGEAYNNPNLQPYDAVRNNPLLKGMNIPDELQQERIASLPVSMDRVYSGIIGESPDQRFIRNQKERNAIYQNMTPQEKARGLLNINGIRVKWNEDNMNDVRKDFPDIGVV